MRSRLWVLLFDVFSFVFWCFVFVVCLLLFGVFVCLLICQLSFVVYCFSLVVVFVVWSLLGLVAID